MGFFVEANHFLSYILREIVLIASIDNKTCMEYKLWSRFFFFINIDYFSPCILKTLGSKRCGLNRFFFPL